MASATATVFLPDCLLTTSVTAGYSFRSEALRCSSALSSATPMSRIFTDVVPSHGNRDIAEILRVDDAPHRPDRQLARALVDAATRKLEVLEAQRIRNIGDRQVGRRSSCRDRREREFPAGGLR